MQVGVLIIILSKCAYFYWYNFIWGRHYSIYGGISPQLKSVLYWKLIKCRNECKYEMPVLVGNAVHFLEIRLKILLVVPIRVMLIYLVGDQAHSQNNRWTKIRDTFQNWNSLKISRGIHPEINQGYPLFAVFFTQKYPDEPDPDRTRPWWTARKSNIILT